MFNSFLSQVEDGTLTEEEFEILAQVLDGEMDINDLAQTDADSGIQRSEGFLAAINRMKDSAMSTMQTLGKSMSKGVTNLAAACTNCMGNATAGLKTMLGGGSGVNRTTEDRF